jgi:hypothetical protein
MRNKEHVEASLRKNINAGTAMNKYCTSKHSERLGYIAQFTEMQPTKL